MFLLKTRRERESVIVQVMIEMYCTEKHKSVGSLCKECQSLSVYAEKRLLSCMYGEIKPVCKQLPGTLLFTSHARTNAPGYELGRATYDLSETYFCCHTFYRQFDSSEIQKETYI